LLNPSNLSGLGLWETVRKQIGWQTGFLDELTRHRLIRRLIGIEVTDLIQNTSKKLEDSGVDSVEELQTLPHNVVSFSDELELMNRQLKDFLFQNMYRHYRVFRMQVKAEKILEDLFNAYIQSLEILPLAVQERAKSGTNYRAVTDYIAGMTDRFALQEHSKLFDPKVRP
jgi:dGTPase